VKVHKPLVNVQVPVAESAKVGAGRLAELRDLRPADLDQYLGALSDLKQGTGLPGSMRGLQAAPKPRSKEAEAAISAHSERTQNELAHVGLGLRELYKDGLVTHEELIPLKQLDQRLEAVLALKDSGALAMLPPDVRKRLEAQLFGPVAELHAAAQQHWAAGVKQAIPGGDAAIAERFAKGVLYTTVDAEAIKAGRSSIAGVDRYAPGDLIAIPRSSGGATLGVVSHVGEGKLQALIPMSGGFAAKNVDADQVAAQNPLKIGDYFPNVGGHEVWISGLGADGQLTGVSRAHGQSAALSGAEVAQLAEQIRGLVKHESLAEVRTARRPPIEHGTVTRTGGAQTIDGIDSARGQRFDGGLYTSRGPTVEKHGFEYKPYNEDGAYLGVVKTKAGEVALAGAFDQAGGHKGIDGQDGAASKIAAAHLQDASLAVAGGAEPRAALEGAIWSAQEEILAKNAAHGVEMATTVAAGVIKDGLAHVVSCGDSKVWHFSKDGRLKNETHPHNLGDQLAAKSGDPNAGLQYSNVLTTCLGSKSHAPEIEYAKWKVEPGDYLVFGSDGIGDANLAAQKAAFKAGQPWTQDGGTLTNKHLGGLIARSADAMAATEAIRDYALGQMAAGHAKPDNTTVVVVQAT